MSEAVSSNARGRRSLAPDGSGTDEPIVVLIVDDDSWTTRAVAAALVDDGGFSVLEPQHSGEDAIEAFDRHRPDLVLMDVNMHPGMSGVDATREIMALDQEATIVLLTTVSPGPGITRALEAGAIAAVNKSASDAELVGVARAAVAGESPALLRSLAEDIMISGDMVAGDSGEPGAPGESGESGQAAPELTPRERVLLKQICEGMSYEEIAEAQVLTMHTVKSHAQNLRLKLGAKNLAQVVIRAIRYKFYVPE